MCQFAPVVAHLRQVKGGDNLTLTVLQAVVSLGVHPYSTNSFRFPVSDSRLHPF